MFVGNGLVVHSLSARLVLDVPLRFHYFPGFVLHGVLGRKLRQFSCALKRERCEGCPLISHCAYAFFFISQKPKTQDVLPGRLQMPHPWLIRLGRDFDGMPQVSELDMTLLLFGYAVESAHILLLALKEAGKDGLLETRVPFKTKIVRLNGREWDGSPSDLKQLIELGNTWVFNPDMAVAERQLRLSLLSPLRIKVKGKYCNQFKSADLFRAAKERLSVLCSLYGHLGSGEALRFDFDSDYIHHQELKWIDYSRWSGRQKTTMKLGGVVGEIALQGLSDPGLNCLLKGAEIVGLGKGTSFGLGEVKLKKQLM